MDNIKNDYYFLEKILNDIKFIITNTSNYSIDEITSNPLLIDSIMFRLIQISENGNRLSEEFKMKHEEIPWKFIKGMRNKIVHEYGYVDMTIVYRTITISIPKLKEMLEQIIKIY